MSAPKPSAVRLTPRETETAVAVLQNLRSGEIKIDYVAMAATLGLKNDKVAAAVWCALRKKLFADGGSPPFKVEAAKVTKSATKKTNQKNGAVAQTPKTKNKTTTTPGEDSSLHDQT
ncbi:uncharacterized protein A1O9_03727 [Exophiala aquamarina CBS 119918]|uniref:Uncharacterized protein n=1 Tax=Exophiala aquamarina CBS 119918 TaxID=1182545 RepID=A0A072PFJ2_9EURO|nr:uncharacterized protein A1O9_03727 [Exophiala aquamarina CBS 119918]KEF58884.1 hypothetical protein A1O9_03727 [Exophiala aquamarina CBS 119918]